MMRIAVLAGVVLVAAGSSGGAYGQARVAVDPNGHTEPNPGQVRTLERRDGVAPSQAGQQNTTDELSQMGAQLKRQAAQDARASANAPKPVPP